MNAFYFFLALILFVNFPLKGASKEPLKNKAPVQLAQKKLASEEPKMSINALQKEIIMLSLQSKSCNNSSDCTTLPLGQKLCGGPQTHIILSKTSDNYQKLKEMSQRHTARSKENNRQNKKGMFGTCSVVIPPQVHCENNLCTQKKMNRRPQFK